MENQNKKGLDTDEKGFETEIKDDDKVKTPKNFKYDLEYFKKRRTQLDGIFNTIKSDLRELSEYFSPRNCRFLVSDVNKAYKKSKKIVDSVTLTAVRNFASGMQSGATSAATTWFKIQMKNQILNKDNEVKIWLKKQEDLQRQILEASNFYQAMLEVYKQLAVYGFSAVVMNPDYHTVVNFQLLPIGSYRYAKDHRGNIDTFCRAYMEKAQNLVREYGYENCSRAVQQAYDNNDGVSLFEIVYFVEANKEYDKNSPLASKKKYISVTFECGQDEKFLRKSGFDRFPVALFEAEVNGEDEYPSNCPAIEALPDAKQLMMQVKEYAKGIKKLVSPLYKAPASLQKLKGFVDAPSAIIPEDDNGRGLSPVYEINPRILELKQSNDELKEVIKEHFYNDLFAVILNTAERGRTATEVNELKEEKMVLLSPLLDQVHKGLRQIQDWVFYRTVETGIIPMPPDLVANEDIEIIFVSTLALAQKVKGISSIERFTTFTANLAQTFDPSLSFKVNGDRVVDIYAEIANIDPELLTPQEEVDKRRQAQAEQQAQAQQMQQLQQGADMIKTLGGIDSSGADLQQRLGLG